MNSDRLGGFLGELSQQEAADLHAGGRRRRYERGNIIFHEGERSDQVAMILSGRVKVSSVTEDGREVILAITGFEATSFFRPAPSPILCIRYRGKTGEPRVDRGVAGSGEQGPAPPD